MRSDGYHFETCMRNIPRLGYNDRLWKVICFRDLQLTHNSNQGSQTGLSDHDTLLHTLSKS